MARFLIRTTVAKPFNEHRQALTHRASAPTTAVAVDTRRRFVADKKGRGSYDRRKVRVALED